MGTWGVGIFQNDIGDDIKTEYINKLKLGKNSENIFEELMSENRELLNDPDDACDFWLALSSVMYDYGRLTDNVKNKALEIIESEDEIMRWAGTDVNKRKKELIKLKEKLTSEPMLEKKVTVLKKYMTKWKANEIYYAKVKDICKSENEGFVIFLVHDTIEYDLRINGLGDILPITYMKYSETEPNNIDDIDNISFIKNYTLQNIPHYRFLWISDGFKKVNSKFVFLGSKDFERPDNNIEMTYIDKLNSMAFLNRIPEYI